MPSYKSIQPDSVKANYGPNENISFSLNHNGEKIVPDTIRVYGELQIVNNNDTCVADTDTGIHSVWANISVEFEKVGLVQNLLSPARYQKMRSQALQSDGQKIASSRNVVALKLARSNQMNSLLKGKAGTADRMPFMCPLYCLMNESSQAVPYSRTGQITINLRTASTNEFLSHGDANTTYQLNDLELHYQTQPEADKDSKTPVKALTHYSVKHIISSSRASVSTRVPATVQSVAVSFIPSAQENQPDQNHLKCSLPDGVESIQFTFNDGQDLVKFPLKEREEILMNYFHSMGSSPYNSIRISQMDLSGNQYGQGLNFGTLVDLTNQSLGYEMVSGIAVPTSMYMYFSGVVEF